MYALDAPAGCASRQRPDGAGARAGLPAVAVKMPVPRDRACYKAMVATALALGTPLIKAFVP